MAKVHVHGVRVMRHIPSFGLVGLLFVGCGGLFSGMPYATGARTIFSQDQTCPPERVTVTERPDVPAHQILGGTTEDKPPAAVAADPGRLKMWNDQHAGSSAAIDASWKVYEVRGCDLDAYYACQHPSLADATAQVGRIVGDESLTVGDSTPAGTEVRSAVRCQSNVSKQLAMQAGAPEGDVDARVTAANLPVLAPHTPMPALPPELRGVRVWNTERAHSVPVAECHGLAAAFDSKIGWTPVDGAAVPHDVTVQSDCFSSAVVTHGDAMFVLTPLGLPATLTFFAPDGTVIDTLPPFPTTMQCPAPDTIACNAAFSEFVDATMAGGIASSTKLRDWLRAHSPGK
jgi:hypothetical protein